MLEIFSTSCGLIQSILILFKRKENWIFYLANIISLAAFSFFAHLYGIPRHIPVQERVSDRYRARQTTPQDEQVVG